MANNPAISLKEMLGIVVFAFGVLGVLLAFGVGKELSALITLGVTVALATLSLQIKIIEGNRNKYAYIMGDSGRELYDAIKNAKRTIVLTAFSQDQPTQDYINLLHRKLEDGVALTRFVPLGARQKHEYSWLHSFVQKKHYVEIELAQNVLPFDVYIFDDEATKVYFPYGPEQEYFKDGIRFVDPKIASMFKTALHKMRG